MIYDLVVIGAGAGGCFTAIRLAEFSPGAKVCILEAARKPLSKVEISGGGRCNVTHACFDPEELVKFYPRGQEVLLEPFKIFQPNDLIDWFRSKGVAIKKEADGRMFPVSNSSSTIIDCFLHEINKNKIELRTATRVLEWGYAESVWSITLYNGEILRSRNLLISSGSDQRIWNSLQALNFNIIPPVPSLFTFNIPDKTLQSLMGISKGNVDLSIPSIQMQASGPLLITHWGLSGPAVLKLSAWGARELYSCGYVFDLHVNWLRSQAESFSAFIQSLIKENPKKYIHNFVISDFPARLWKYLCIKAEIPEFTSGAEFGKKQMNRLMNVLTNDIYRVTGKSTFKEEFVTAGGVDLDEIDFKKFESKKYLGLFLVGEVLNIDAVTGGFNFQAAWTGAHIAAKAIAKRM
jgi:predicted Rossmann fold flavoprotein